jgi:hypothetical protein
MDSDVESVHPSEGGTAVARVSCIFQFSNLSSVGIALLDEFQSQHPEIRVLSSTPTQRAMAWFTQRERGQLIELAQQVETLDPEKGPVNEEQGRC